MAIYFTGVFIAVSGNTLPHTCLFPQSSIAFMILPTSSILTSWPPTEKSTIPSLLAQNLDKFCKLHHKCYVLITSPLIGHHEQAVVSMLQDFYLKENLQFLPLHSCNECLSCMFNIAKVTCKPLSGLIQQRMSEFEREIESEDSILAILKGIKFSESECVMVLDGCGGLSGLAQASVEDLMDLNLDSKTVERVMRLLHGKQN